MALRMHDTFGLPNRSAFTKGTLAETGRSVAGTRGTAPSVSDRLQQIISDRADRSRYFPEDMFADPAWDILLELALAEQRQLRVSVTSLCVGSRVPQTTALRWIKHMTDMGWLIRRDDPLDARRKFIELSEETSARMRAYLLSLDPDTIV